MKNQNPFEENFENNQPREIQKSEIFGALKNYSNPMMVKKIGSEIKSQIKNTILPFLNTKKEELQISLSAFLSNTTILPTKPCYVKININKEEFPYKQYTWEEVNWSEKAFGQVFKGFGDVEESDCCCDAREVESTTIPVYCSQSKEESEARKRYNDLVEDFRDILMDIKTANVLIENLKDKDEYYLNIEQLCCLKFGEK